ncbi:MAG: sigma-70 family RNA polymerase sigma factor [Deltaproteobacteria bacterium]|nr:sigma-70 family RNA polymerase sigma factor [Deltaproteobacteria bacterium]
MATPLGNAADLFERYGPAIHRRCRDMLRDSDAAHDAVQEVFLRAHRHAARFRGDAAPFTWLYRIATTYCLQQLRNRARRAAKLEAFVAPEGVVPDLAARIDLQRAFSEEDEETLLLAHLRWVDGLTLEEVAEVVELSRKTVAKRLEDLRTRSAARLKSEVER